MIDDENFRAAYEIGCTLIFKRIVRPWGFLGIDEEEEKQEWALHLTRYLPTYDPAKSKITTWAYAVFTNWTHKRMVKRQKLWGHEEVWNPIEPSEDTDRPLLDWREPLWDSESIEWSDRAEAIVHHFPPKVQPSVRSHWGEGLSLTATADAIGVSERTVCRHIAEARTYLQDNPIELEAAA